MVEQWCQEKLENLKLGENCLETLTEIRSKLYETSRLESVITNRLLSSPEIYNCVKDIKMGENQQQNQSQAEQMSVVNDILEILMSNVSIDQNEFPQLLQKALSHPQGHIRAIALNAILKEVQSHSANNLKCSISDTLVYHIFDALKRPEAECGVPALGILAIVLEDCVDRPDVQATMLAMLKENEVARCRLYEIAINLGKKSPGLLFKVVFILDNCVRELDTDDVLMQVNILEILYPLAEVNYGLVYLEQKQVFEVLSAKIEQIHQKPMDRLLVPGIMKFFGKTATLQPQKILCGYPFLINSLFEFFRNSDVEMLPVALDTLANLARTCTGKNLLNQFYSDQMDKTMEEMSIMLRSTNVDLKKRIISCLIQIFTKTSIEVEATDISGILEKWFLQLSGGPNLQFLFDYCRNPFPDIKICSLELAIALCSHDWGTVALKNTAGFIEFLLNRSQEFDKEAKYAKFELISLLAERSIFDVQTNIQLKTYVREGPYYEKVQMEVAVEGD